MRTIQYAALNYYNSVVSDECLCLGVLFHELSNDSRTFNFIHNFKRLESFNDEINIDFVKVYLQSIKDEVETSLFNYHTDFDLQSYINTYVNEFRFSKIFQASTEDSNFIENTTKLFLRYDFEKNQRLNKNEETHYIREIFKSNKIPYSSNTPIQGFYNENINFDFLTDKYAIKLFKYKDKNLNNLISNAKIWSYNAKELENTKKVIFLYDMEILDSPQFTIIMDILSEHSYKTMTIETGIQYILENIA